MNNDVKDSTGKIIGYRCQSCDEVKTKMWGIYCNQCHDNNQKYLKLLSRIASLEKIIKNK